MNGLPALRVCRKHKKLLMTAQRFISTTNKLSNGERVRPPVSLGHPSTDMVSEHESTLSGNQEILASPATLQPQIFSQSESTTSDTEDFSTARPITYDIRKVDPVTVKQVFFFDTLGLVKSLQNNGYSRQQAEGLAECLVEVINTTLEHQSRHMITKSQQEITVQQLMSEISSVKKDMVILQKSEFSSLRNETEKQTYEIRQIKDSLRDEIAKLKGQMTLDINLERSRAVEAHAENQKNLLQLNQKIEMEVAHLRTIYEQYRNDVFKYAGGTVLTCAGLCLGIMRLWN